MITSFAIIAVIANTLTALRLIVYRRDNSSYKWEMSLVAWILIALSGGYAIDVATNLTPVSPYGAGLSVVLCVLVWRAHGNVSNVVRCAT